MPSYPGDSHRQVEACMEQGAGRGPLESVGTMPLHPSRQAWSSAVLGLAHQPLLRVSGTPGRLPSTGAVISHHLEGQRGRQDSL